MSNNFTEDNDGLFRYIDAQGERTKGTINTSEVATITAVGGGLISVLTKSSGINIVDLPYITLQGGGQYIHFPIAIGDDCMVVFTKHNNDGWYESREQLANATYAVSNGMVIVGINSQNTAIKAQPYTEIRVKQISINNEQDDLVVLVSDLMKLLQDVIANNSTMAGDVANAKVEHSGPKPMTSGTKSTFNAHKSKYTDFGTILTDIKSRYDAMKV